jgi:hypothetical protein
VNRVRSGSIEPKRLSSEVRVLAVVSEETSYQAAAILKQHEGRLRREKELRAAMNMIEELKDVSAAVQEAL